MLSNEAYSIDKADYHETYASASRTDEHIRMSMFVLLNDLSLSDLPVNDLEDFEWVN